MDRLPVHLAWGTMNLSKKQFGVLKGIIAGLSVTISVILYGIIFDPFSFSTLTSIESKLNVLAMSLFLPTVFLVISIGRLAKHRFFTPEDIDGIALSKGPNKAVLLQSLLQNTLEQLLITVCVYIIWCFSMPVDWLSVLPLCSILFALGRSAFYFGYQKGAPSRSFGFSLTFYPTVLLMLIMAIYYLSNTLS